MPHFTTQDGRSLHYCDSGGAGPVVLCLAGLTRNHRDFEPLAAHLAPHHRVLRLDSRGRGLSDRAVDPIAEYTVPVETADALALIDHLELTRLAIIGTSRGGILGMAIAAARPGLVAALVLNDLGALVEAQGLKRIIGYLGRAPESRDFQGAARESEAANAAQFPGLTAAIWARMARQLYDDDAGRPVLAYDPRLRDAVAASFEGEVASVDLWPLFETLTDVPMLVIRGALSDILTAETLAAMAARHPMLQNVTIADRGHAPFLDEPLAITAIDRILEARL
ncbi:MAG: alpha/beta hydrolase [Pseudomonadota bacterium]